MHATNTTEQVKPRRLTLRQIARSIVLDLRSQDRVEGDERTADAQISGWWSSAVQAGDRPVFQAIDYLGKGVAATIYERGGKSHRVSPDDLARLERWWTRSSK